MSDPIALARMIVKVDLPKDEMENIGHLLMFMRDRKNIKGPGSITFSANKDGNTQVIEYRLNFTVR